MANHTNILTKRVSYPNQSFDGALAAPTSRQLLIHSIAAYNGTAGNQDVGIGYSLNSTRSQSGFSGTSYVIQSRQIFDMVALSINTADTSGSTFGMQYWNGSSWVTLTTLANPAVTSTGNTAIFFNAPIDWMLDASGFYSIRITASGTPNYVVGTIKICEMIAFRQMIYPYASVQVRFETRQKLLQQGAEIIAYFSSPNSSNRVETSYQINP
jgi:hypothetical protein